MIFNKEYTVHRPPLLEDLIMSTLKMSTEERTAIVTWRIQGKTCNEIRNKFETKFNKAGPTDKKIRKLVNNFEQTGSVRDGGKSRKPRMSEDSVNSSSSEFNPVEVLKVRIRDECTVDHGYENGLEIRRVVMREDFKDIDSLKVQRLSLGIANSRANKIILLVGVTGGGKTTLINAMVNYIFGVDFADNYRFILIDDKDTPMRSQAKGQTDLITAYAFNHLPGMPFDYNYVLIDTPGFGNTHGVQRDQEMMKQMKAFFENDYGVSQVDCIGMVVPASEPRLTQTQSYVFDGLSSMFGRDVRNNIFVMATFSDDGPPAVTKVLEEAKVPYEAMYKFNNSAMYSGNDVTDPEVAISKYNWAMSTKSMTDLFYKLGTTLPVSLQLTKEVLRSRSQLQSCLAALDVLIHIGLDKMVTLNKEKAMLANIKCDLKDCENHERDIEVPKIRKLCNTGGCTRKKFRMNLSFDLAHVVQSLVSVVTRGIKGICNSFGLGKPGSSDKRPEPFKLEIDYSQEQDGPNLSLEDIGYEYVREKRTVKQLMDRYRKVQKKMDKEQVIKAIDDDIKQFGSQVLHLIAQTQAYEQLLKNIALKHNYLSTKDYIDPMIRKERNQRSLCWEKRVEMLTQLKKDAGALKFVSRTGRGDVQREFVNQLTEFGDLWK